MSVTTYPVTHKSEHTDSYCGQTVSDPYQWLEDDHSPATKAWVTAQNTVTESYLSQLPAREPLLARLTQIWDYPKYQTPFKRGGYYVSLRNNGLQNHAVAYIQTSLDAEPEILLDPNTFAEDGSVALAALSISRDGRYLAYAISQSGSDWKTIHVMEIATRKVLADCIDWVRFSRPEWFGAGFFYSGYDKPVDGMEFSGKSESPRIYYHRLGTAQQEDELIHADPAEAGKLLNISVSDDESLQILYESVKGQDGNALAVRRAGDADWLWINRDCQHKYYFVGNIGSSLLLMSNENAPRWQLLAVDVGNTRRDAWATLIPEQDVVMESVSLVGDKLLVAYLRDAHSLVSVYTCKGQFLHDMPLPGVGSCYGMNGHWGDDEGFYTFTSFTSPAAVYRYDAASNTSALLHQPTVDFDAAQYTTQQHFYSSRDGTQIPMFLIHRKGLVLDGQNPLYLYGYGGFNVSLTPGFYVSWLVLLEQGFVIAVPNLRGGGEYGEGWHQAGTQFNKQNVFDDFIAAAEYLIVQGYTCSGKLAIVGGSNGGLLVGACMAQRPELFRVALPSVGVMDMLKYQKFTIGWAWIAEYGSSEDSEEMFRYLLGYSPLHNLREGVEYPATLVTTADHDDRVVPAHSFKFAATLQEKYRGKRPMLIHVQTKAGHGAGRATRMMIQERANEWAFLFDQLGVMPSV